MDKFFMLSLLGLLFASYGVAGTMVYDDISMLDDELESWDIEEDNDWDFYENPSWTSERGSKVLVNVDSFGAVGDGVSDDTQVKLYCLCLNISCHSYVL